MAHLPAVLTLSTENQPFCHCKPTFKMPNSSLSKIIKNHSQRLFAWFTAHSTTRQTFLIGNLFSAISVPVRRPCSLLGNNHLTAAGDGWPLTAFLRCLIDGGYLFEQGKLFYYLRKFRLAHGLSCLVFPFLQHFLPCPLSTLGSLGTWTEFSSPTQSKRFGPRNHGPWNPSRISGTKFWKPVLAAYDLVCMPFLH